MTTQLVRELVDAKRLGRKLDLPSNIENITDKLEFGDKVCPLGLRDHIFILRNCCAPYSMVVYERIMEVFGVYETLFSIYPTQTHFRIVEKLLKDRSQSVNMIFVQKVHFITSRSARYEGRKSAKGGI